MADANGLTWMGGEWRYVNGVVMSANDMNGIITEQELPYQHLEITLTSS